MSYLLTHRAEGDKHWVRLDREEGMHIHHVLSASFTDCELAAFIEMCRKLDPHTKVVPVVDRELFVRRGA